MYIIDPSLYYVSFIETLSLTSKTLINEINQIFNLTRKKGYCQQINEIVTYYDSINEKDSHRIYDRAPFCIRHQASYLGIIVQCDGLR